VSMMIKEIEMLFTKWSCVVFAFISVGLCSAAEPAAENLLLNGAFDRGKAHWSLHAEKGAKAAFRVEPVNGNPAGYVEVTEAGPRGSFVQFTCSFPQSTLKSGEIYRVSFHCKSPLPRNTRVSLMEQGKPWENAGMGRDFSMTQQWQTHQACFRAKAVPCPKVKLNFFLGGTSGDVWIDNVSIVHVDIKKLSARQKSAGDIQISAQSSTFFINERGCIIALNNQYTKNNLIFPLDKHPAFRLTLRQGQNILERTSGQSDSITHERKGQRVNFTAKFPDMTVRYSYEPYGRDGLLACRIAVENRSEWAVTEVDYPRIFCPGKLGESSEDDRLLYPLFDGGIVVDPYEKMMGKSLDSTYPGPLSCQVMAFYDPAGGVVMASLDPTGEVKRLWAKGDLNMSMGVTQLRPVTPGADVVVDQPVVIGAFKGSWHDAAEVYRKWAHQQSFCATPLHSNPLWPKKFRNGAMVNYFSPERLDKNKKYKYSLENLKTIMPELKARSGLPMITISWGWEQHGMWCSQEYFPAFPSDEDFAARGDLFDKYGTGMVMLSGFRWTFEKPWAPRGAYDGTEIFNREVKPWVTCRDSPGTPTIVKSEKKSYQGSKYATLCRATRFSNETISEICQRCVKAGYTIIHWDQCTSGGASQAFCLSPDHGHPPGYGRWIHTSLVELYEQLRKECGGMSPDFALSMEEPNELYIPYLQLIQSRPYVITADFPMRPPLTEAVPLFMYLYHDYQAGWASHLPASSTGDHPVRTVAKGFAAGCMPGMLHLILYHPSIGWAPACREMYFKCCRLYREEGLPFLLYGRMMKPLDIDVPVRVIQVKRKNSKTTQSLSVPAFYHSVWQAPDGRRAVVFFNPEETAYTVRLPDGRTVTIEPQDCKLCELK
jgi:hypothetical protein